jgi:hypothetical protein
MAVELGLKSVAPQRGSEALKANRLVDPDTTSKEPQIGFARGGSRIQKKLADAVAEEAARHPGKKIEVFATDEHRLGLKPVTRRVWAPIGERPIAHGHHRFDWLYVTAFSHRPQAKPSGIFPMVYRRNFSRHCLKPSRAKPEQA